MPLNVSVSFLKKNNEVESIIIDKTNFIHQQMFFFLQMFLPSMKRRDRTSIRCQNIGPSVAKNWDVGGGVEFRNWYMTIYIVSTPSLFLRTDLHIPVIPI